MSEDFDTDPPPGPAPSVIAQALRRKIGWLCQIIRFAAIVWSGWILYFLMTFWGDRAHVQSVYGKAFSYDASGLPDLNYYASVGLMLFEWALTAIVALTIWRLFARYLAGEIFTVAAALSLRRVALIGAATQLFEILSRPVIFRLMTAGHEIAGRSGWFIAPGDLLNAIFITFLFSLAYIFKTAAELADEHAQIV